jgi:hypothetical protein
MSIQPDQCALRIYRLDRSHALRGNASLDAPRPFRPVTQSVTDCIPTRERGNDQTGLCRSFGWKGRGIKARGGVGLGLSAARAIVLEHGGTLTVRNRSGGGLEARVVLPVQEG